MSIRPVFIVAMRDVPESTHVYPQSVEAMGLVGGEPGKPHNRIFYPVNASRKQDLPLSEWWGDVPAQQMGPHDGLPDAVRK